MTVAAIGPGTARALRAHGVEADVVPERAVAEGLVEALADVPFERVLIARAAEGRDVLIDALRERGATVDVVALYETVPEPLDDAARAGAAAADYVLFTSASSVRFFAAAGGELRRPAAGLDRARHERRTARARRRARPRGRPAHAGRAHRRAARGRRIVPGMSLGEPREHLPTVGSTNERARELAEDGAAHGTLVTADEQTAGRGRQGRSWSTPPGVAIAASLILREFDELLPLRAGLAVADVAGPDALVKWPNDVWIDGRKIAGILVEARGDEWAILGIGVNVAVDPSTLPPDGGGGRGDARPATRR